MTVNTTVDPRGVEFYQSLADFWWDRKFSLSDRMNVNCMMAAVRADETTANTV